MAKPKICSVPNCGKPARGHGWCSAHYTRWRRHGDPLFRERPANGEPARYLRDVVLPYEGNDCLTWPYGCIKGYGVIHCDDRHQLVSHLVCERAHGPAPTPDHQAAHSCGKGNQGCVTKGHLSWKTRKENEADKLIHGTHNRGERHNMAKLTNEEVRVIRSLEGLMPQREIAGRFNVTRQMVYRIHHRKAWAWLD